MKTLTTLQNLFTSLSNNNSSANQTLGIQLLNDQHRYLIQKYFDNERTVTLSTIGSMSLTSTGALAIGATTATLTAPWTYANCHQLVNFSGDQRDVTFTNGSTTISWLTGLNNAATTAIKTVGVQYYSIPANVSKMKDDTINVGQLKFQTKPIQTRQEWDFVNFLPYNSDIPNYSFIYNGTLGIFPIPSTTGNILTFNYKTRVADLTFSDYTTGHVDAAGAVVGGSTVTGLGTAWITTGTFPAGVDITYYNLNIRMNPPFGDGIWYPITSFTSGILLNLALPIINAPNITASTTYTIGQLPLLQEDFQDMLVYGALMVYFTSIVDDSSKFKMYDALYKERLELLKDYAGTKQIDVDLGSEPQAVNPNLFLYAN